MGICLVLGFSSGLPLFLLMTLLSAWLRKSGIDLKVIGIMSLIMVPYTWKFLWAPLVDRYRLLGRGRRSGWILVTQILLVISIGSLGFFDPKLSIWAVSIVALLIALSSATQDIAVDAYRRELLSDNELGLGNSLFVNASRISSLVPGSLSLILADFMSWRLVFLITAAFMLPGIVVTALLKEKDETVPPKNLKEAIIEPWREFFTRNGVSFAVSVMLFVCLYKIGLSMCTALATPFYIDLGYNLTTIGIVAKNIGLWCMVIGALLGGLLMLKIGINKALWLFGITQMLSITGFALLAKSGESGTPSVWFLSFAIGAESLGSGLATAAFVSFIATTTNRKFTATQFALLTSVSAIPRTFCNASTGYLVEALGWTSFYWLCLLISVPGLLLLFKIAPWAGQTKEI
ncbi:MAG: MFS transporter [Succinivibrio sp.]|nr:MFS transporter [Succinivibrio sp.]